MHISKRMSQLAAISRGLDDTNPEFKKKSRLKLADKLRRVIAEVYQLEKNLDESDTIIAICKENAFSLHDLINASELDPKELKIAVMDLLEILEVFES